MGKKVSNEELLENLKKVYEKYGYISKKTIDEFGGYKNHLYFKRFKTLNDAMKIIGIDVELNTKIKNKEAFKNINKKHSDEELLDILRNYNITIGLPTQRDFMASKGLPSYVTYHSRFGSFQNALVKAGIEIPEEKQWFYEREEYSKDYLLNQLKIQTEIKLKNGGISLLTNDEIDTIENMPSTATYVSNFGGVINAYKLIGIDYSEFNKALLEKDMKEKYIALAKEIGRTPTSRDLDKYSKIGKCYGMTTYSNHFNNFNEFQKELGLDITVGIGRNMEETEGLEKLSQLYEELGRVPTQIEVEKCNYCPSISWFHKKFGSFTQALKTSNISNDVVDNYLNSNGVMITSKGNKALSLYEYLFLVMLEEYDISFEKEVYYKKYIKNFNRMFRFDFVVNIGGNFYMVEIFGITNNEKYNKRKNEKISLCKNNNIPLIDLYREDIIGKKSEELYKMLIKKISEIEKQ